MPGTIPTDKMILKIRKPGYTYPHHGNAAILIPADANPTTEGNFLPAVSNIIPRNISSSTTPNSAMNAQWLTIEARLFSSIWYYSLRMYVTCRTMNWIAIWIIPWNT